MHPVPIPLRRLIHGRDAVLRTMLALVAGGAATAASEEIPVPPPAAAAYWPPENARDLLALDEPMKQFFGARVSRSDFASHRLQSIVEAIAGTEGLNFTYESTGIYDAREAFRRRRGNCQAFAFLVAAVAREYGLEVRFQELETFQSWNRFGSFIASVRHTNVRMRNPAGSYVVDLRPALGQPTLTSTRYVVSDEHACAVFYSTAGFFRLVEGDPAGALRLMKLGTETDPRCASVWANLGNLYIQQDELEPARKSFERALQLDPKEPAALVGLVNALRRQGGPEELKLAGKFEHLAQIHRDRNPYYAYHLAELALEAGDLKDAEGHLGRAIRLKGDEPVFRERQVTVLRQPGREDEALKAEKKLAKLRAKLESYATHVMP